MTNTAKLSLSRRGLLAGAGAAALGLAGGASGPLAKAPMANSQAPAFYRFKLGAFEGTIVTDGPLPLGEPSGAFLGASKDEIGKMLNDNFLPANNIVLQQNALVLNTGDRLVVFDTGMGSLQMFGPTTGRLLATLRQAGINPADIDAVVMTHGHVDHLGGNVGDDGKPNFPNAQFYIHQADYDFWTDEAKLSTPMKDFVAFARKNLVPVRDRLIFFKDGQEFLPGVQAIHTPGHTVGHTMFMITSGGQSMCNIGDLTHHHVLLLERPRLEFAYDTDPKQSAATRVKALDMLASTRTPIVAYHFPWPGIGHVAKQGDGFRYIASPMHAML